MLGSSSPLTIFLFSCLVNLSGPVPFDFDFDFELFLRIPPSEVLVPLVELEGTPSEEVVCADFLLTGAA